MEETLKRLRIKSWKGVIAAVLVALIGWAANYSYKKLELEQERIKQKENTKSTVRPHFGNDIEILHELYELIDKTDANRALIVVVHNGTSERLVNSTQTFDILYEAKRGVNTAKIKKKYQNMPLDAGTVRLMNEAIQNPFGSVYIPDVSQSELLNHPYTLSVLKYEGIRSMSCKYLGVDRSTTSKQFFLYINHFKPNPHKQNEFITKHLYQSGRILRMKLNTY